MTRKTGTEGRKSTISKIPENVTRHNKKRQPRPLAGHFEFDECDGSEDNRESAHHVKVFFYAIRMAPKH